jgi:hypothetical protein
MPHRPQITCPCCHGRGKIFLTEPHYRVWLQIAQLPDDATGYHAQELATYFGTKPCAMNNRLEKLRALGLATRTKIGKTWFYRAVHP